MEVRITSTGKRHTAKSLQNLSGIDHIQSRELKRGGVVKVRDKDALALEGVGLVSVVGGKPEAKPKGRNKEANDA